MIKMKMIKNDKMISVVLSKSKHSLIKKNNQKNVQLHK